MDPCSLLDKTEVSEYGEFEGPDESTLAGDPVCSWKVPLDSASDAEAPMIDLTLFGGLSVDEVKDMGDGLQSGTTEKTGRKLVKSSGIDPVTKTPDCRIAMEVGSSRLDILVGFTADPCDLAERVAEIVDPKLPQG